MSRYHKWSGFLNSNGLPEKTVERIEINEKEEEKREENEGTSTRSSTSVLGKHLTLPYELYLKCTAIQIKPDPQHNFRSGREPQGVAAPLRNPRRVFVHHGAGDYNALHIKRIATAAAPRNVAKQELCTQRFQGLLIVTYLSPYSTLYQDWLH
jgi:hypothetical protein